jgi:energy-coupling factor transport system ATP-binding protein
MIELKELSFKYKQNLPYVLKGINLSIKPGEKVLIAGKNGAGKTTLSKILSGLIPHAESGMIEGEYNYCGKPMKDHSRRDVVRELSILLQDFEAQIVSTSVKEELMFYPLNLGKSYKESSHKAGRTAEIYGIGGIYERNIAELSGGEKQKTALVSLLTAGPEILILDEPLTDMDPASQEQIFELLMEFAGTLIVFEQSVDFYRYFDRIILIKDGAVILDGGKTAAADEAPLKKAGIGVPPVFYLTGKYSGGIAQAAQQAASMYEFDAEKYSRISAGRVDSAEKIVEIRNLSFNYPGGSVNALDNVSLEIRKGDFITLLGENGSGKTTLMKLICGILTGYRQGEILYRGRDIRINPVLGEIGYVYQNPDNQIFAETVFDEIAFGLRTRRVAEDIVRKKTMDIMEVFGLADKRDADPFSLPKGDREKTACASILVSGPEVVILDEPTTGLDYPSLKALMEIICGLNAAGRTIIIITHSMEAASAYGWKAAAMASGKMEFCGDKRRLFSDAALMEKVRIKRTPVMELGLEMNGRLVLNEEEFMKCWRKK